jgi:hypothetical protein
MMPKTLTLAVLVGAAGAVVTRDTGPRVPFVDQLPAAAVTMRDRELVFELDPTDLPAALVHADGDHGGHMMGHDGHGERTGPGWPPVARVTLPASGAIYGFRVELVDSAGNRLPDVLLHHLNLIDPYHRELFLPISRRVIAAGKETGEQRMPWLMFGLPFQKGDEWVLSAMLHNPTATAYSGVRTRLVIQFVPGRRPWPFFDVYPWQLDVLFPAGDKSFDLPPGRSLWSYDAQPAIDGWIVALGGHVHERALRIGLVDVTANDTIWQTSPVTDSTGRVTRVPIGRLYRWHRLGATVEAEHRYRVIVEYDNPTGAVIPQGGMGVVGGLFAPEDPDLWPASDPTDSLYLVDLRHYLRLDPATPVPVATGEQHRHY